MFPLVPSREREAIAFEVRPFHKCNNFRPERDAPMISPELLEILACPDCLSPVFLDGEAIQCTKAECRRRYEVRDGIPVMLIDESKVLDPAEFQKALARRSEKKS